MLKLIDIKKTYIVGDNKVNALKGINLTFREHEFVSILGQSGCGKTTLLNIIGGLDKYTSGDLIINGISTKEYTDHDWDTYRNHTIGFVFQNYNLIPHQTVLSNVELALTLSGVSKDERRNRAIEVLEKVGLGDQLYKKPSQMSGGQMQRVAIARALVNNPDILLADEPTGALDTETSVQIMDLLKEVAKDKLVIMVTHNPELAEQYSTRIIRLLDGNVTDDTMPVSENEMISEKDSSLSNAKTSMSFKTALSLSLNNLMTKKARTFLTAFAGSIGIIGIALILSLSNGIQEYIDSVEEETLSSYPITIEKDVVDMTGIMEAMMSSYENPDNEKDKIYSKNVVSQALQAMVADSKKNNLEDFKAFLDSSEEIKNCTNAVQYSYNVQPNIFLNSQDTVLRVNPFDISGSEMMSSSAGSNMGMSFMSNIWIEMMDNQVLMESQYNLVAGKWPSGANECVLVVDKYNQIYDLTLYALGLKDANALYDMFYDAMTNMGSGEYAEDMETDDTVYDIEDILGLSYKLVLPTDYYKLDEATGKYLDMSADKDYMKSVIENAQTINLVGIISIKEDSVATSIPGGSIAYTSALTEYYINAIQDSDIAKAQLDNQDINIISGRPFEDSDSTEVTPEFKAEEFKKYADSLTTSEKASLFLNIYAAPSDEEIQAMVDEYCKAYPDTESKKQFIIDSMITALENVKNGNMSIDNLGIVGMDENALNSLLEMSNEDIQTMLSQLYSSLTDEEMEVMFTTTAKQAITMLYTSNLGSEFDSLSNDELADMLDNYIGGKSVEKLAKLFDKCKKDIYSNLTYDEVLSKFGLCYIEDPLRINIYAKSFEDKNNLKNIIDDYNNDVSEENRIAYTDYVGLMMSSVTKIIDIISYVLISFVSISLVVSSIMIGIITYISVLERTKEIGILRSIGASKKDISRVFNAEAVTIGFVSGMIGILVTLLLNIPINIIIKHLTKVETISRLPVAGAIILVLISMFLTFIAGLIPSRMAAKKDPVLALRSE